MTPAKKLKRGLEDLSPLFQEAPITAAAEQSLIADPLSLQGSTGGILALCRGDETNFNAGLSLAQEFFPNENDAFLVSIQEERGRLLPKQKRSFSLRRAGAGLYHYHFSWEEFNHLIQSSSPGKFFRAGLSKNVILNFNLHDNLPSENLMPLLDKCIFWVQPCFESLSEIYKNMKLSVVFNHGLECYLVYDGNPRDARGGFIFETLAEISAKQLGVNLIWLGTATAAPEGEELLCDLKLEHLWLKPIERTLSPEKLQLLRFAASPPREDGV